MPNGPELARAGAALTHGHPTGQVSSATFARLINSLLGGESLVDAVEDALLCACAFPGGEETQDALRAAIDLAASDQLPSEALVESLGGAWIGEQALAIGVYCALVYPSRDQILDALSLAVCHGGDSDSTGTICGNILGTLHGVSALPPHLVEAVEGREVTERLAAECVAGET